MTTTDRRDFNSAEVDPRDDYTPRHRRASAAGWLEAGNRDTLARRIPNHPLATYVGKHRKAAA